MRSENTWQEIRDHSFIQNHSRSSDSQLLLFSSPHSSSTGFRSENTWHEIRDHSFIQNHSRSSDSQLLLFSSPHSSSTGFRSENTWHEIRDHSFIQNHSRSSDSQLLLFSSLIFYRVQVREHLTRDQRPFLHPESLQIFRFTASSLQFTHSSSTGFRSENTWHEIRDHSFIQNHSRPVRLTSSTGFRSENTWHEIRDHSFIQNHSRSSDSQLLLFSSLTHLLQASDQRTPDTRSETIPSSRITPDLQINSFSSSVHSSSTGFRSENTWHEIRDHSFIQNHSRSSDSQLLLFSSPHSSSTGFRSENTWHEIRDHSFIQNHSRSFRFTASPLQFTSFIFYRVQIREHLTRDQRPFLHPESLQIFRFTASPLQFTHLLQGSGQRTPDTRSETIPSSRITPDLQIHSFFSSVHLTHLLQGSGQRTPDTRSETIPSSRITPDPSDSQLLLFSSLTHLLQGSDQRTPDTRSETIPSSRITPDLQIHSFSSSVHSSSTGFRSENTWHEIRDHSFIQNHSRSFRFTASSLQFTHSSSTGFRSENTWHEIRDHSFIQNHSRSFRFTASSLQFTSLIFYRVQVREHLTRDQRSFLHPESLQIFRFTASPLQFTHLLQGSVQRTLDTRSETIPSSRITPDLQIHSFSSSVHSSSTGFSSENTWHEIRDHSFIQNHSRSSDSQLLLFSSPHSSSTGFSSENTWHEIRDHSFIQNHSRSSDSQLLLFSSLTHLLQGSDQRTLDTRSETIPSSRITPDLQIHSFFSSVHLTHLLQGSDQRTPDTRSETIPSSRITPDLQIHSFSSSVHSLIFYRVQIREHLTRDQRPFLHPESLQIFRFTASSLQFTSLIFYRVQVREHLTRDQRPFLHPESLQILQIHSFFSSVHSLIFYRVQIREHLTWDQRPFLHPESLQILYIHSFMWFSSVHLSHYIWVQVRGLEWPYFVPIFVLFLRFVFGLLYGWKIQTWHIIIFLKESVTYWFIICWYLI